jgi:energy-coupling factor transport system ATP-binding protein
MPLIELRDVQYWYGREVEALRGVSLEIREGEFIALLGQNGSGKTTLAKHLNGLLKPTSGTVLVSAKDTRTARIAQLSRTVGYVFQNPDHMIFAKTIFDEVAFGLRNVKTPETEIPPLVDRALALVDLKKPLTEDPHSLSMGERRRLTIASVLALDPKVLILDEPTTGVDYHRASLLMETVVQLNQTGRTIILITHDIALAAEYSNRTIILKDGGILADGPTRSVLSQPQLTSQSNILPPQVSMLAERLSTFGFPPQTVRISEAAEWLLAHI